MNLQSFFSHSYSSLFLLSPFAILSDDNVGFLSFARRSNKKKKEKEQIIDILHTFSPFFDWRKKIQQNDWQLNSPFFSSSFFSPSDHQSKLDRSVNQ